MISNGDITPAPNRFFELPSLLRKQPAVAVAARRLAMIATAVRATVAVDGNSGGDGGGRSRQTAALATVVVICDDGGGKGRRRAAEGGGGSSVDVLDVPIMCGSDSPSFPYNPTVGIVQRQKSRFLPPVEG